MCTFNVSRQILNIDRQLIITTKANILTKTFNYLCCQKYIQLKRFGQQLLHPFNKRKTRKKSNNKNRNNKKKQMTKLTQIFKMCSRNIKISVVLFLVLIPLITALPHNHNVSKRSNFFDLECKGIFNKTMFFRLDRICEDCYQLFRETSIHRLCKKDCFVSKWFGECLKVLFIPAEEVSQLQYFIKVINGSPIFLPIQNPT